MTIARTDPRYPAALTRAMGKDAPASLTALGNLDLLQAQARAFFCSVQCPGNLILQTYDLAQNWRDHGVTVIGGFHTPMERECLRILLRGAQPIIIVLARNLGARQILPAWRDALAQNRLLVLSPFPRASRISAERSAYRNRVVAALAARVFIAYAAPGGKTEMLAREFGASKTFETFDDAANANLVQCGAQAHER